MSLRRRVALVSAAAVAIAVLLASATTYVLTSHQLRGQIDSQLRERARSLKGKPTAKSDLAGTAKPFTTHNPFFGTVHSGSADRSDDSHHGTSPFGNLPPRPNQVRGYQQGIDSSGKIRYRSDPSVTLPVDARTRTLAAHGGGSFFEDARVKGTNLRILTEALPVTDGHGAVQFAQSLTEVEHLLAHLRLLFLLLDAGGIALAAILGRLVAGAAVSPVRRLTETAEHVAMTRDLSRRIPPARPDEIGRLAVSFNGMLDTLQQSMQALDRSVDAQRQLVADASHELRTPVTSLRTNVEILQQRPDLPECDRGRLLGDIVDQTEELTLLVNDLIDLARGEQRNDDVEDIRLDMLIEEAVDRARRHSPTTFLTTDLDPTLISGIPDRLGRAINNLIDNAVKYSPPTAPIEIALHGHHLTVRDHGPGISSEDLPHVFDRFYRGADSRGRPGSGLGLAIVRQVVEQHHGTVTAENALGGGTIMCVDFPTAETLDPDEPPVAQLSPVRAH